ncbi:DUF397 domain-containing protein [Streptomyces omiyaensis]|uniref:DUF397 domain-containing protein n=1 Tax=Streptomyces omiyaensis TaxID=68247 RepID=UPI001673A9F4|nr:DUF397 domain-containing protein [Streptomyces omiyaensis]GGY64802.1 hypothetical protein GCM10010363_52740 [Streptomyces omiyaensis]
MTTGSPLWFKSSYSADGGQCVEVAHNFVPSLRVVPIRDSKTPAAPTVSVSAAAFTAFVDALKDR